MIRNNREKTFLAIMEDKEFLAARIEGFSGLPEYQQFDQAMRFNNSQKVRLQKGKMAVDIISNLVPLVMAAVIYALAKR